ncbi:GGDEF domain-containing protein [candidate division TA06 bacterium]|uniref:GGDEF domain-containing protein n=1 Tax=candidate division TA06 bacterium TaxID=2250710 RepID=A0A523UY41_UNCT6|nr:MAG: GGDEF domain-containing protein [candidate division TA06 bacterium]
MMSMGQFSNLLPILVFLGLALLVTITLAVTTYRKSAVERALAKAKIQAVQARIKKIEADSRERVRAISDNVESLESEISHKTAQLTLMQDLARDLGSLESREMIPKRLMSAVEKILDAGEASFFLPTADGKKLKLHLAYGLPAEVPRDLTINMGEGFIGYTAVKRVIMARKDFEKESNIVRERIEETTHSGLITEICAPLYFRDELMGVLNLSRLNVCTELEKVILRTIASIGAMAMENAKLFEKTQHLADTDGLTQLFNKRKFKELLEIEASRITRYKDIGHMLSFIMFDIDHFKSYNDQHGHPAGDEVLRRIGQLLRENTRQIDIPARYGGEEFIIIVPHVNKEGAYRLAERIRFLVEREKFPGEETQPGGKLTISGGVASYPEDANDTETALESADKALYAAKRAGKNRVVAFRTDMAAVTQS